MLDKLECFSIVNSPEMFLSFVVGATFFFLYLARPTVYIRVPSTL
jgi:hypothetical protein